jgi:CshA-type fibril repeat protein
VIPPPTVVPDTSTGPWDTNQTRNVITNNVNTGDSAAAGTTLAAGSVRLCAPTDTAPNCTIDASGSVVIANQGTYTVDPTTGVVTFDPLPTFKGTATAVTYSVTDALGQKSSTTYTPTISAPPAPAADPETTTGIKGAAQTIDLLPGDTTFDPAITLDPASVKLCGISPAEVMPNCTQSSLTVSGVGTYSVSNGVMTFTPEPNYTGTTSPVSYQVTDSLGGKATSTYTPTVIPPPTVVPDTSTGPWDTNQTRNVITNNVNTGDSAAAGTTLAAGSVRLCAPTDTAPNCTVDASGSVVIANQGTYTVDPATGVVTFDPLPTFTGTATPVTYSVTDALGQKSSTTYTPTVTAPAISATPDRKVVVPGGTVTFTPITGAGGLATGTQLLTSGANDTCLYAATVQIATIGTTSPACDADNVITVAGVGTFTLDPATGIVTFVADPAATPGVKPSVTYMVTDVTGQTATSTLTPIIPPVPVASPDASSGVQGATQILSLSGNDNPGGGASISLTPASIFLCAANQPPPDCAATTVTVPGEGVYTVGNTGLITFVPEPNFIGVATAVGYQIPDNLGQKAYSTLQVTVVPAPAPQANPDTGSAAYNQPVTLSPWLNDIAGAVPAGSTVAAPSIVANSIKLCGSDDPATNNVDESLAPNCNATTLTTVEGTYVVDSGTGKVVFTPVTGFVGTVANPPMYQIWNNYAGVGGAKYTTSLLVPTIAPPGAPVASVDITSTKPGISVIVNPVLNDTPGYAALNPLTIKLCGQGELAPTCSQMQVTTIDGTYVVDPDTGKVMFTPRDGFTGKATLPYVITDMLGMVANSNIIITVEDAAKVVPVVHKKKTGLAQTGGHRPDLLALFALLAFAAAGGLRMASRRKA